MRFILGYPEKHGIDGDLLDGGPIGEVAALAERVGFEGFALTEHPIPGANWLEHGGHQTVDPFVGLAFAAAATERLRLLTYLAVVPYRNPFLLAKAAATLDRLSGGRFILGIGTGYHKAEFFALGVDFEERNALMDEALEVLPLAWKGEPFSYRGLHFDARDVIFMPTPAQDPLPIWIGGNAKVTLQRVAERAQGWMPLAGPPEMAKSTKTPHLGDLEGLRSRVETLMADAGPRAAELDVAFPYDDVTIFEPTVHADRHREKFAALEAAGVTWIAVTAPARAATGVREFVQGFGETYCA